MTILQHPNALVTLDPPQPASVRDDSPASSAPLRLHLAETSAPDGRRQPSDDERLDALRQLEALMDRFGSEHVRTLSWNLAAERRKQGVR